MYTAPNQRIINVSKDTPAKGTRKPFAAIFLEYIEAASKNLQGEVAFKMWLYLASNANNYCFAWSPAAFAEAYGCSEKSAREAFNQLVAKNYLVQKTNRKNEYTFYELPVVATAEAADIEPVEPTKLFIDKATGKTTAMTFGQLLEKFNNEALAQIYWSQAKDA